jgi:hypothetical protein
VRRTVWFLAAWAAATILSGSLAWVVVGMAGARVSDTPIHALSSGEVALLGEGTLSTTTTSVAPTTSVGGTESSSAVGSEEVTVHRVAGGTVILRVVQGVLQLVSVTPEEGYRAVVGSSGPHQVSVDLIGHEHEAEFDAELVDGRVVVSSDEGGD